MTLIYKGVLFFGSISLMLSVCYFITLVFWFAVRAAS